MEIILLISFILAVACYLVLPLMDPDLWWHIVAGRWIVAHKAVPHTDYWTDFGAGLPWRAYSWSNEVVLALTEQYFGVEGLIVLKALLALGIVVSFVYVYSKISHDVFFAALLGAFTTLALSSHYTLRPQSVTWILFTWLFHVLVSIDKSHFNRKHAVALFAIFCAWANTHLSAILPLGAVVFWLFPTHRLDVKTASLAAGSAFLGTLLTPYLGGEWLTFLEKTSHPAHFARIAEFGPANILQYHTSFLLLSAAFVIWAIVENPRVFSFGKLLGAVAFTFLGLAIIKFIPLAIIYNAMLFAVAYRPTSSGRISQTIRNLAFVVFRIPKNGLSFLLLCAAIVMFFQTWQRPLAARIAVRTLNFIIDKKLPPPFLNTFNNGGYISYRFADQNGEPGAKVSIDGRTNLIPPEVWKQYTDTMYGYENWKVYINRVNPNTIIWSMTSPLIALLKQSGEWCEVFREGLGDEGLVTFVKKGSYPTCS